MSLASRTVFEFLGLGLEDQGLGLELSISLKIGQFSVEDNRFFTQILSHTLIFSSIFFKYFLFSSNENL